MKVSDCKISDEYLVCDINDSVLNISKDIKKNQFINQVIVLENKKPKGIISIRDVVERVVADELSPSEIKAKEIMTSPIVTVKISEDVKGVANIMTKNKFLSLPVVDDNERFSGIITIYDVMKAQN